MGTRNLTLVQLNNEIKVAQYGQWDGYPEGNGRVVYDFIQYCNLEKFKEKLLNNTRMISKDEVSKCWIECGADPDSKWVELPVVNAFNEKYPSLGRDCGADILKLILTSDNEVLLQNDLDFAKDSLFCEWAYLLNLDTNELEVYSGFVKEPLDKDERFYFDGYCDKNGYYPIKMIKKYKFDELPVFDVFVKDLCKED